MELTLKEGCWIEFCIAAATLEHVVLLRVQLTAEEVRRYYTRCSWNTSVLEAICDTGFG